MIWGIVIATAVVVIILEARRDRDGRPPLTLARSKPDLELPFDPKLEAQFAEAKAYVQEQGLKPCFTDIARDVAARAQAEADERASQEKAEADRREYIEIVRANAIARLNRGVSQGVH